jgi:HSP20 family molecular chaperone IbpA
MANQQELAQTNGDSTAADRRALQDSPAIRPPVDVFENSEGITLQADMPGVSKDRLKLNVDGNNLLLEGTIEFPMAAQMQALYADLRSTVYRCSFVLSNELETGKIQAKLKDGVLSVHIPKRAELRARRIEVQTS